MKKKYLLLILSLGVFLTFCDSSPTEADRQNIDLTDSWTTAAPAEVGMNASIISSGVAKAAQNSRFLSLLAVRNGKLVVEEYFNGNTRNTLNDVRSVTKSVISTLVGLALVEGFISSLDETLGDYLHPDVVVMDNEAQDITIENLLTMSGGFDWDESGGYGSYSDWITSGDHINFVLDQPIVDDPGTNFTYNSGAVHLLGVLIEEAVEMPLPQFADDYLFDKIGIDNALWEPLSDGYVNGGAGVDLRPRDLARLGQLYLQGGKTEELQVLPVNWVSEATKPRFSWRASYGPLQSYTYGYLWWIEEGQNVPMYLAWGFGGQFIFVIPALDLVVVTTTNWRNIGQDGGPQQLELLALDVIVNHVIASVGN